MGVLSRQREQYMLSPCSKNVCGMLKKQPGQLGRTGRAKETAEKGGGDGRRGINEYKKLN